MKIDIGIEHRSHSAECPADCDGAGWHAVALFMTDSGRVIDSLSKGPFASREEAEAYSDGEMTASLKEYFPLHREEPSICVICNKPASVDPVTRICIGCGSS